MPEEKFYMNYGFLILFLVGFFYGGYSLYLTTQEHNQPVFSNENESEKLIILPGKITGMLAGLIGFMLFIPVMILLSLFTTNTMAAYAQMITILSIIVNGLMWGISLGSIGYHLNKKEKLI